MNETRTCWAYITRDGRILADSSFENEAHVWTIALGWPHADEIRAAKAKGDRVERVTIVAKLKGTTDV